MKTPEPEKIAKLPAWAREYIDDLERSRFVAIRSLNEYCDASTPSPFIVEDAVCTGETAGPSFKKHYIQGIAIRVMFAGVNLRVSAHDYNGQRGIGLQWSSVNDVDDVAMIPTSYNAVEIVARSNMRTSDEP